MPPRRAGALCPVLACSVRIRAERDRRPLRLGRGAAAALDLSEGTPVGVLRILLWPRWPRRRLRSGIPRNRRGWRGRAPSQERGNPADARGVRPGRRTDLLAALDLS